MLVKMEGAYTMDTLLQDDLRELMERAEGLCVSLYMPTHPAHLERQQEDQLRLRNLIDEARTQMVHTAPTLRTPDVQAMLQPATKLLQFDGDFWKHQRGGLAIFLAPGFSRVYRLPLDCEPMVMVSSRFYVRPLLPLLTGHGRFYLLALSQNQVRLFHATQDGINEVELQDVPTSMEEALAYDDPERQLQFHGAAAAPGAAGKRAAVFYGRDAPSSYKKEALLRYCQQVNAGLRPYLHNESAPLLLACVDYLFAIYQEANSYTHLFPTCVSGSPDRLGAKALHEKAWALVQPSFQQAREEAQARYWRLLGKGQASADVKRIVVAASQGRVETLFTAAAGQQWGTVNQQTGEVCLHEHAIPDDQELLNLAAIYTLTNGGMVYTLQPDELPDGVKLAASFRY
jgi:hypothetical protein